MIPFHIAIRVAILACTVPLAAQHTWHVNCNGGPGVDFTDLPPAVAAAAAGDTILVYYDNQQQPWCQTLYTAPTITKALQIEGFSLFAGSPPSTSLPTMPSLAGVAGIITVSGIPAGQRVVLSNLTTALRPDTWPVPPAGISITDCNGTVLLENIKFSSYGMTGSVLSIVRGGDVVLRDNEYLLGDVPIHIEDSHVLLSTCLVDHEPPLTVGLPPWTTLAYTETNVPALDLVGSDVTVVGSVLRAYARLQNAPEPAVRLAHSTLRVGPASIVTGASSSGGTWLAYFATNPAGCAVYIDPRAVVMGQNPSVPPASIPTAIDATYHSRVVAGYPYAVSVAGPEDGFAMMLLGDLAVTPTPTIFGNVALDPNTVQIVGLVHLTPSGGNYNWYPSCPTSAPVAHPFVFQALTLSTTGQFGVTVRSPLTVGWQHGAAP